MEPICNKLLKNKCVCFDYIQWSFLRTNNIYHTIKYTHRHLQKLVTKFIHEIRKKTYHQLNPCLQCKIMWTSKQYKQIIRLKFIPLIESMLTTQNSADISKQNNKQITRLESLVWYHSHHNLDNEHTHITIFNYVQLGTLGIKQNHSK